MKQGMFCSNQLCCQKIVKVKCPKTGKPKQYKTFKAQILRSTNLNTKSCPECGQDLFIKKLNPHDLKEAQCKQL